MHIVMITNAEAFMDTEVLKDARTRCISLFFKSLTSRADQVGIVEVATGLLGRGVRG